jgi:hypothetical protein
MTLDTYGKVPDRMPLSDAQIAMTEARPFMNAQMSLSEFTTKT